MAQNGYSGGDVLYKRWCWLLETPSIWPARLVVKICRGWMFMRVRLCVLCELGPAIAQVSISSMIEGSGPRASGDKWRSRPPQPTEALHRASCSPSALEAYCPAISVPSGGIKSRRPRRIMTFSHIESITLESNILNLRLHTLATLLQLLHFQYYLDLSLCVFPMGYYP